MASNSVRLGGSNIDLVRMRWYLARLAAMGPAEILWRARSAAMLLFDWACYKRKTEGAGSQVDTADSALYWIYYHFFINRSQQVFINRSQQGLTADFNTKTYYDKKDPAMAAYPGYRDFAYDVKDLNTLVERSLAPPHYRDSVNDHRRTARLAPRTGPACAGHGLPDRLN